MATKKTLKKTENLGVQDNPSEDIVVEDTVKEPKEKIEEDIVVDSKVKSAPMQTKNNTKNVKAKFLKDYHCVVGGEYYEFKKGKTYTIPSNVKMVVAKANGVLDPM